MSETSREVRHYRSKTLAGESFTIIIHKVDRVELPHQKGFTRFKGMFPSFTI